MPGGAVTLFPITLSHTDDGFAVVVFNVQTDTEEPFDTNTHGNLFVPAFIRILSPKHAAISKEANVDPHIKTPTLVSMRLASLLAIFQKIIVGQSE